MIAFPKTKERFLLSITRRPFSITLVKPAAELKNS